MKQLRKAQRKQPKIKLALQGPSGSGKTMSALLLAYGLICNWDKIAIIDTENNSADLSHILVIILNYDFKSHFLQKGILKPLKPAKMQE